MSNCILNKGFALGCRDSQGGLQEIYLGTYSSTTVFATNSAGEITGATGANTFYKFEFPSEVTEAKEDATLSIGNQSKVVKQTINSILYKSDQITRDTLSLLGMNRLFAITKDNTGQYVLYGKKSGLWLTSSSTSAGKAYGDLNGITYTLEGTEATEGKVVAQAYITTLSL